MARNPRMVAQRKVKQPKGSLMAQGTWTDVFPASLNTRTESLAFMQKLVAVGVSNIMYLRSSFPEEAFTDRKLDGLKLKVLNRDASCQEASDLCQCINSAFDAVEKGYLKEIVLAVLKDAEDPASVLETYTFGFEYADFGASGDGAPNKFKNLRINLSFGIGSMSSTETAIVEKDDIYRQTRSLLHKINVATNNMELLPEDAYLHVMLNYYEERTPADYEPPGFVSSDWDLEAECAGDNVDAVISPSVRTKHHGLSVRIRSSRIPANILHPASQTSDLSKLTQDEVRGKLVCICEVDDDNQVSSGDEVDGAKALERVKLECYLCGSVQHGECFQVFKAEQMPERHACPDCAIELGGDDFCADPKIVRKMRSGKNVRDSARFRLTLFFCYKKDTVTLGGIQRLMKCDGVLAERIMEKLLTDQVVRKGHDGLLEVNQEVLEELVGPKYLGKNFETLVNESKDKHVPDPPDMITPTKNSISANGSPVSGLAQQTERLNVTEMARKRKPSQCEASSPPVRKAKKRSQWKKSNNAGTKI